MHANFLHLVELQDLDTRLAAARARLAAFPARQSAAAARLAAAHEAIAAARGALTQSLKDRKTFEMDVDSWKERVRKYKDQTAQIKSNDAYRALLHEIENAEKEVSQAEDRLLDRMVAGEEFDRRVKAAEAALHAMEGEVAVERTQIAAEKAAVEQEQTALETQHAAARALVPGELIDLYQKIAKRHHGVGLAQVRGESCGQCGFMVRPHVVQDMRRETEEVFRCEGCSRILFYVEAAPQAAAAQGK